jgi:hypothetical protein
MDETTPAAPADPAPERRDADGLPLDREPTMDDVRGGDHFGHRLAVGCAGAVILAVAIFWALRMFVLR